MGPVGEFVAAPGSPVANEVDLLTVLEHELGHVLGLADNAQAGDIMDVTLGLAVSRTPTSADLAAIASPSKIAIDVPVFDTATPALINQNPAVPNGTQPGVLNVSVPMLPVNVTPLSSSPSNGPSRKRLWTRLWRRSSTRPAGTAMTKTRPQSAAPRAPPEPPTLWPSDYKPAKRTFDRGIRSLPPWIALITVYVQVHHGRAQNRPARMSRTIPKKCPPGDFHRPAGKPGPERVLTPM